MAVADVLLRGRDSARRLRSIDDELLLLRERIGVQGHGYEATDKSGIRDPARHIDNYLDATTDYDRERASCLQDVTEGFMLCRGVSREVSEVLGLILKAYYLHLLSVHDIADVLHMDRHDVAQAVSRSTLAELDRIGVPKLMQAGAEVGESRELSSDMDLSLDGAVSASGV